jgi:hypothetical protein
MEEERKEDKVYNKIHPINTYNFVYTKEEVLEDINKFKHAILEFTVILNEISRKLLPNHVYTNFTFVRLMEQNRELI